MRKLNRFFPGPDCLSKYDYRTQGWTLQSPTKRERIRIWAAIRQMQNGFCCYCESVADKGCGHIEHFFHKGTQPDGSSPYKNLTFIWDNLFGCCGSSSGDTCGHFKDRRGNYGPGEYDPLDIIKPDVDDPAKYFYFLSTGLIKIKDGLDEIDTNRAKETLRVLNLAHGSLNGARKKQIDIFKSELLALTKLKIPDDELNLVVDNIKQKIKSSEFQTAVLNSLF